MASINSEAMKHKSDSDKSELRDMTLNTSDTKDVSAGNEKSVSFASWLVVLQRALSIRTYTTETHSPSPDSVWYEDTRRTCAKLHAECAPQSFVS